MPALKVQEKSPFADDWKTSRLKLWRSSSINRVARAAHVRQDHSKLFAAITANDICIADAVVIRDSARSTLITGRMTARVSFA